jgi:hypothetical protein
MICEISDRCPRAYQAKPLVKSSELAQTPLPRNQRLAQSMNLLVYSQRVSHGPDHFVAQKLVISLSQTMDKRFYSTRTHLELLGDLVIGR